MEVTVEYAAQVKRAAGIASETLPLDEGDSTRELLAAIADRHGQPLTDILLDADGKLQRSILVFVGDRQAREDAPLALADRDIVTILSPISGG